MDEISFFGAVLGIPAKFMCDISVHRVIVEIKNGLEVYQFCFSRENPNVAEISRIHQQNFAKK